LDDPGNREEADSLAVTRLGVLWVRQQGFTIDRPRGLGECYLLLRFYTPMLVRTAAGIVHGEPGDCLLYEPTFPQWYTGRGVGFIDDWVHIAGQGMPEAIRRYRLPVNALFRPRELDFFSPILQAMSREQQRREPYWQDSVRMLVEQLLMRLGRSLEEQESSQLRPVELAGPDILRSVRMEVHGRLEERWTVDKMAHLANMSGSRFAVLYKTVLGVSPVEDLVEARLARAQDLLLNSDMSVSEVAAQTGFSSSSYFSRIFRRRVGLTPTDYQHGRVRERERTETTG
jgi:AraC-like DNA-binding protein